MDRLRGAMAAVVLWAAFGLISPAAQAQGASVQVVVTPYTIDVAGKRVAETRKITRGDLAQHTVGGRVLEPLRKALREALASGGGVRVKMGRDVPLWFAGAVVNAALWEDAVTSLVIEAGKETFPVRKPPRACSSTPNLCASPGVIVSSAGVLVRAVAGQSSGAVPCGGVTLPSWNLSVVRGKGAGKCTSFARNASAADRDVVWKDVSKAAPTCGIARVYGPGDSTWGDAADGLPRGMDLVFGPVAVTDGCDPEAVVPPVAAAVPAASSAATP